MMAASTPYLPSISVVIPCYNGEKYIASTLHSALAQDWPGLEIIVVDDGSTDGSAQLVERAFPAIKLVRQPNQGVAAARNTGIKAAKGEWIAFLDADDIWLSNKLHHQWRLLEKNPHARMNYTAWEVWPSEDAAPDEAILARLQLQSDGKEWEGPSGWLYGPLLLDCVVWTSTVLVHRSVFEDVGDFDTSLRIGEDYDLWLRASRVTEILRVPKPLALYRTHAASITKKVPSKNYQGIVVQRALDRWALLSPDGSVAQKNAVYRALARTWVNFAAANLYAGQTAQAREAAMNAIGTYWRDPAAWKLFLRIISRMPHVHRQAPRPDTSVK